MTPSLFLFRVMNVGQFASSVSLRARTEIKILPHFTPCIHAWTLLSASRVILVIHFPRWLRSAWTSAPRPFLSPWLRGDAVRTKTPLQRISGPLFPYMVMSVAAWPLPKTVSEARALTAAAAHRSLPYLEVSSTKTARRGGQGRGEERG